MLVKCFDVRLIVSVLSLFSSFSRYFPMTHSFAYSLSCYHLPIFYSRSSTHYFLLFLSLSPYQFIPYALINTFPHPSFVYSHSFANSFNLFIHIKKTRNRQLHPLSNCLHIYFRLKQKLFIDFCRKKTWKRRKQFLRKSVALLLLYRKVFCKTPPLRHQYAPPHSLWTTPSTA